MRDVMPLGPRVARSHVHVTCNMSHHVAMSGQDRPIRITCTQLSDPRFHLTYRTYTVKPSSYRTKVYVKYTAVDCACACAAVSRCWLCSLCRPTGPRRLTWCGFWRSPYGRLDGADARRPKRRVVAVLTKHRTPCSDFRLLMSHVSHNRTERALQLASSISTDNTSSPAQRCWSCHRAVHSSCQIPCTAWRDRMRVVPT